MKAFILRHKISTGLLGALLLFVSFALAYLNWMFEENGVTKVDSVAHHVGAKRVFAAFAHPDDEQLVTGVLYRASADAAILTAAVTATKGEAGTPLPQISRLSDLGAIRKAEALKNTWALGVDHHEVLDFPDGGLQSIPLTKLTSAIRERMLRYKPGLVVTFWPESGFSGHADHKKVGLATETLIRDLLATPVDGYAGPSHIAYMLAPTRMMSRFAGDVGRSVVANQPLANIAQDGEAWAKIRGWEIHASQADYVQHAYGLPPWLIHRLFDKEYYYLIETKDIPARINSNAGPIKTVTSP